MSSILNVAIHASQFPEQVRRDLHESLRTGRVNHKFHYDSIKQTQKWLALFQAYSPASTDPDGQAIYERSFVAVERRLRPRRVHVVGLGCGAGHKDALLLKVLTGVGREVFYTPADVSSAMVLYARQAALASIPEHACRPLVCDLATTRDLRNLLETLCAPGAIRVFTFFGMIPNFEPKLIMPKLANLVRPHDLLLLSANLAPGRNYRAGVQRILPLYDNALTRDWLMAFLLDLGVDPGDGDLRFRVEAAPDRSGLQRVVARFYFRQRRELQVDQEHYLFSPGDSIRLFFSYRHTPARIRRLLGRQGLRVMDAWITRSQEEGVFLVGRPFETMC